MWRRGITAGLLALLSLGTMTPNTQAAGPPVIDESNLDLTAAIEENAWTRPVPLWEVWNQSAGAAYAKKGERNIIEAASICQPPRAFHQAAAKLVYRWRAGIGGFTAMKVLGTIHGQLISYPGVGLSGGEAKVTITLRDSTADEQLLDLSVFRDTPPSIVEQVLVKQQAAENRAEGKPLGDWMTVLMVQDHDYELTVKLWTECWVRGFMTVRTDFSRHTLSTRKNPLIGMVLVDRIQFRFPGQAGEEGSGDEDHS